MTIRNYIESNRTSMMDELQAITDEIKADERDLTKEELIFLAIKIADGAAKIYNTGFDTCLKLVDKADVNFLNRKLPPHLRK